MISPDSKRLRSHVPSFAKRTIGAALEGKTPAIQGERVSLSRQTVYSEVQRAVEQHARLQLEDNDPRLDEDAADQDGRVKYRTLDFHFSGEATEGEVLAIRGDSLEHSRVTKSKVQVTGHGGNGETFYRELNLVDPEKSYEIRESGQDTSGEEQRPLPTGEQRPAKPVSPGVMSLTQALDSENGVAKAIYLDKSMDLADYRLQQTEKIGEYVDSLPAELGSKFEKALQQKKSYLPQELHGLSQKALAQSGESQAEVLKSIKKLAGDWAAVESLPGSSADGITKKMDHYVAPQALQMMTASRNWDFDEETGLPIADSIVVGAGPGGLASAYHLAEAGQHNIVFEAGAAGQAFSDKHAKSVHFLRTSESSSNLIYTDDLREFNHEASLTRQQFQIEAHTTKAQEEWVERSGESLHGRESDTTGSSIQALPRAGLYDHMQRLATGLAEKYPDTFLIEQSPVTTLEETENGFFKVTTAKGHQALSRTLVVASGFVGPNGENARVLRQIEASSEESGAGAIFIGDDHDEMAQSEALQANQEALREGRVDKVLAFSDRKLGSPVVRNQLANLPKESEIALVGGGESGAKAALEILSINPDAKVVFYTSDKLEPYQTQVPAGHLDDDAIKEFHQHEELAERSRELLEDFGSPITPDTLRSILRAVKSGQIELKNLGERFGPESVETKLVDQEDGKAMEISIVSDSAKKSVRAEQEDLKRTGLIDEVPVQNTTRRVRAFVSAIGYHTERSKLGPLAQQLVDQNLLDPTTGETDSRIFVNTAGLATDTADTALVGRAVKGWETPFRLRKHLPEREVPEDKMDTQAEWWGRVIERRPLTNVHRTYEEAVDNLEAGAVDFGVLAFSKRNTETHPKNEAGEIRTQFQIRRHQFARHSPMGAIDFMAKNYPDSLSPEEKLLSERSNDLIKRTNNVEEQTREVAFSKVDSK